MILRINVVQQPASTCTRRHGIRIAKVTVLHTWAGLFAAHSLMAYAIRDMHDGWRSLPASLCRVSLERQQDKTKAVIICAVSILGILGSR